MLYVKFNDAFQFIHRDPAQIPPALVAAIFIAVPDFIWDLFFALAPATDHIHVLVGSNTNGGGCLDPDDFCYGWWRIF